MSNWICCGKEYKEITDFPRGCFGFIYMITNKETRQFYIGKKQIFSNINKKLGKKEIAALPTTRGRKATKKLIIKESDWKTYSSSSKELQKEVNLSPDNFHKQILYFCYNKKQLSYYEVYYQFKYDVLNNDLSLNENISGHYFKKDL